MRIGFSLVMLISFISLFAQDVNDTVGPPIYRYSVSLQVGQPNRLSGAEVVSDESYYNVMHGDVDRHSLGYGFSFRYYTDETFFLHLRCMYSSRKFNSYDSVVSTTFDMPNSFGTEHHVMSNAYRNYYSTKNILIGIGGGHEKRYGQFLVRAGAEIDFIRYTEMVTYISSGNYDDMSMDSTSGGNYNRLELRGYVDHTIHPKVWGIGITGHATLEYLVKPNLGIGATLYMGGFYVGVKNLTWSQTSGPHNVTTDSNGANIVDDNYTTTELDYSATQFDFSPLNGQINVVFYFGN